MTDKLSATELTLFRGERCLFKDLSFALNPGELLLLEGRNGTGKTSLMRAIAGLIEFEDGDILWEGKPVRTNRQSFYGSLVWMQHRVGFKADLTLVENLRFETHLRAQSGEDFEEVLKRLDIRSSQATANQIVIGRAATSCRTGAHVVITRAALVDGRTIHEPGSRGPCSRDEPDHRASRPGWHVHHGRAPGC